MEAPKPLLVQSWSKAMWGERPKAMGMGKSGAQPHVDTTALIPELPTSGEGACRKSWWGPTVPHLNSLLLLMMLMVISPS